MPELPTGTVTAVFVKATRVELADSARHAPAATFDNQAHMV